MKILKTSFILFSASLILFSCNSGNKKTEATKNVDIEQIISAADAVSPDLNSIDDVIKTLEISHAKYYPVLCNDPYNAPNYLNDKSVAAANLGVYVTDIIYHTYGDATEAMYLAFSAAQELARYIGIESEFAATLLTELEGGSVSKDSLIMAFNDLMEKSKTYNSEKEMMYVHSAFLGGVFVEKLYLLSSLVDQGSKNSDPSTEDIENYKKLVAIYKKQLSSIEELTESLKKSAKDLEIVIDVDEVDKLKDAAHALISESDKIIEAKSITSPEAIKNLHQILVEIRSRIVSAG